MTHTISYAVIRRPSSSFANCELTHIDRTALDVVRARQQHDQYRQALIRCGVQIVEAHSLPNSPDDTFVEDAAVVLDEVAIITRPGAAARRAETESIADIMAPMRRCHRLSAPARIDGGDVLKIGKTLFVGRSSRSDVHGVEALRKVVAPFGYEVIEIPVEGCLHLKTAVTQLGDDSLLLNPAFVDAEAFGMRWVSIADDEPFAANVLRVNGRVLASRSNPKTLALIDREIDQELVPLDFDELEKAEAGLTCCSLLFS